MGIKFECESFESLKDKILNNKIDKKTIFNFLNSHDIYQYKKTKKFKEALDKENQKNFVDGFFISLILSIKNFKKVFRLRGPRFTYNFLKDNKLNNNKKHFFVGLEKQELEKISENSSLNRKRLYNYNPPFIRDIEFPKDEIDRIVKEINKVKPDFLWITIGCPKQNILSMNLYDKIETDYIFNVGAALDFFIGKKKQAPKIVQELGIEWLYRLMTDFKHTYKKVWRSLLGSFYALFIVKLSK